MFGGRVGGTDGRFRARISSAATCSSRCMHIMVLFHHPKCRKPATDYGPKPATRNGQSRQAGASRWNYPAIMRSPPAGTSARRLILGKIAEGNSRPKVAMPEADVKWPKTSIVDMNIRGRLG